MDEVRSADSYQTFAAKSGEAFWTTKQVAINSILLILAAVAAYLEYYLYPQVMSRPPGSGGLGFGETNITLKVSFLTFQYITTRCTSFSCAHLVGIPAFDFFQALIVVLVALNLYHLFDVRRR